MKRRRRHRLAQPSGGAGMVVAQSGAGGHAGEAQRQLAQRDGVGGDRAAVGADRRFGQIGAGGRGQRGAHFAHHRVIRPDVAAHELRRLQPGRACHQAADADEARVFARAVVVQRGRRFAGAGHRLDRAVGIGPVAAALQRRDIEPGLGQQTRGGGHVRRLAAVRGAGQRQFSVVQPEGLGRATGHQRQRLQHLAGRAREDRTVDVAQRGHQPAVAIDDGQRATVERFDDAAAHGVHQVGVGSAHGAGLQWGCGHCSARPGWPPGDRRGDRRAPGRRTAAHDRILA